VVVSVGRGAIHETADRRKFWSDSFFVGIGWMRSQDWSSRKEVDRRRNVQNGGETEKSSRIPMNRYMFGSPLRDSLV
jgi:hypothetical protein